MPLSGRYLSTKHEAPGFIPGTIKGLEKCAEKICYHIFQMGQTRLKVIIQPHTVRTGGDLGGQLDTESAGFPHMASTGFRIPVYMHVPTSGLLE